VKYHLVPIRIILLETESTGVMLLDRLDGLGQLLPDLVYILVRCVLPTGPSFQFGISANGYLRIPT
jgi:hypothetical protein